MSYFNRYLLGGFAGTAPTPGPTPRPGLPTGMTDSGCNVSDTLPNNLRAFTISPTGEYLLAVGFNSTFDEYTLSTPNDLCTATLTGNNFSPPGGGSYGYALGYSADGNWVFARAGGTNTTLFAWPLTTQYGPFNGNAGSRITVCSNTPSSNNIIMDTTGDKIYAMNGDTLHSVDLSTAGDPSTATGNFTTTTATTGPLVSATGLPVITNVGTRVYFTDGTANTIKVADLGTRLDLDSAGTPNSLTDASFNANARISLDTAQTRVYYSVFTGGSSYTINELILTP